jgi:Na+-driven multidrug efflux pump
MKRPLLSRFILAHVVALPIEAINFFLIGTSTGAGSSWYTQILADQWLLIHYTGLRIASLLSQPSHPDWSSAVIFLGGFVETSILFVTTAWFFYFISRQRPPVQTLPGH